MAAFLLMPMRYAAKLATAPDAVRAEFNHPIAGNLDSDALVATGGLRLRQC